MCPFGLFSKKEKPEEEEPAQPETSGGFLGKLRSGLAKTRQKVSGGLRSVLSLHRSIDEELLEELEEQLYLADVGPRAVMRYCEELRQAHSEGQISESEEVIDFLKEMMREDLSHWDTELHLPDEGPAVIMVAGVNGSGKTTSIAKLGNRFLEDGRSVLLAASDTFRAAAIEQLEIWAERIGADIVSNESADPAAVTFDAAEKAIARDYDVLIIDTAGRLHTRRNLMRELQKINRVVGKKIPGAPHETLMVLDATTGQNAISQAIRFNESIELTGIVLAKLDGTAKGGVIFGMQDQIDIPVKFIGIGEGADDLVPFRPEPFVEALFD
ncbi:MAG: signal recognition particle-docking protein FtsY [Candidatus Brocadiia bacterium]